MKEISFLIFVISLIIAAISMLVFILGSIFDWDVNPSSLLDTFIISGLTGGVFGTLYANL